MDTRWNRMVIQSVLLSPLFRSAEGLARIKWICLPFYTQVLGPNWPGLEPATLSIDKRNQKNSLSVCLYVWVYAFVCVCDIEIPMNTNLFSIYTIVVLKHVFFKTVFVLMRVSLTWFNKKMIPKYFALKLTESISISRFISSGIARCDRA